MSRLNRDGVDIHYETYGEGPPILLSHGFSATAQMWKGQIGALSQKNKLVLWDMRGHGQSDYPEDPDLYSEAATLGDMSAILDAVGTETAIVGGLSLGGYMSLAFYRDYPERVKALLIIDTGPGFKKDEAREVWNQNALKTAARYERDGLNLNKSSSPERATSRHRSAAGLAHAARGMLTQRDDSVMRLLPQIRVPTLVIVGSEDTAFLAAADYMAAKIPGAEKVTIPDAGHAANIDQPMLFNDAVTAFLSRHKLCAANLNPPLEGGSNE